MKSPPELWAEVADVTALARHLESAFGDIRITRAEPESVVEWESVRATGTVRLEPSGWGTRVTLTAEPLPGAAPPPEVTAPSPAPEPIAAAPPAPETGSAPAEVAPEPRGLLARLFSRRRPRPEPSVVADPVATAAQAEHVVAPPEPDPVTQAEPVAQAEPDPAPEPLAQSDPDGWDPEAALATLNGTLDHLGFAHHRPFSRG